MSALLDFAREGALLFPDALDAQTVEVLRALADERVGARPGARLQGDVILTDLLASVGTIGALAARLTSPAARPVRAVMFDKTPDANWAVAWHQDRVLPVAQRMEVESFGPGRPRTACCTSPRRSRSWRGWSPCASTSIPSTPPTPRCGLPSAPTASAASPPRTSPPAPPSIR